MVVTSENSRQILKLLTLSVSRPISLREALYTPPCVTSMFEPDFEVHVEKTAGSIIIVVA